MDNRYNDPVYKETITELKEQLKDLRETLREIDDQFPVIQKIIEEKWD